MASLLLLDVKGTFPSTTVDRLIHNMRMKGVPKEHTDWILRRLEGQKTKLIFDDYSSDSFVIDNGLDQGDPHSLICYLFYNAGLAEIPIKRNGESGVLFVDYNSILAVGKDFRTTHAMI